MKPFRIETIIRQLEKNRGMNENGCWLWLGNLDSHGYGTMMRFGKRHSVSRIAMHIYKGMSLDSPNDVCHRDDLCKSRRCFNPDHLYIGTRGQNIRDSVIKGTHKSGFPRKGEL